MEYHVIGKKRRMRIPPAFPKGAGRVPNNPVVAAAIAAILKGGPNARDKQGGWTEGEDGGPVYRHVRKGGGSIVIRFEPAASQDASAASPAALWCHVERLSALTADVLLCALAQICEPTEISRHLFPDAEPTRITADAILGYKGIKRWGAERRDFRRRIRAEIELIDGLRINIEKYPAWDPESQRWNANGVTVLGDRLIDIVTEEVVDADADGDPCASNIAWLVRCGQWGNFWFNSLGRVWLGPMLQALISLDHRQNRGSALLAKRIGQHMILLSVVARNGGVMERRIGSLLESIGELPEEECRGGHWAGRLRDRFDEALLQLRDLGLFETVRWPEGYGPGDVDRHKGWSWHWLAAKISLSFPEELWGGGPGRSERRRRRDAEARKIDRAAEDRLPANDDLKGADVRRARLRHACTQARFARQIGVSTTYLSQVESGRRQLSKELEGRVRSWIDTAEADLDLSGSPG